VPDQQNHTNDRSSQKSEGYHRGHVPDGKRIPDKAWIDTCIMAIPETKMTWVQKGILTYLNFRAGKKQVCYTSYKKIAENTGLRSLETVNNGLNKLVEQGFIRIIPKAGPRKTNVYIITGKTHNRGYFMDWIMIREGLRKLRVSPEILKEKLPKLYDHAKNEISKGDYIPPVREFYGL